MPHHLQAPQRTATGPIDALEIHQRPHFVAEQNPFPLADGFAQREHHRRFAGRGEDGHDRVERDAMPGKDCFAIGDGEEDRQRCQRSGGKYYGQRLWQPQA